MDKKQENDNIEENKDRNKKNFKLIYIFLVIIIIGIIGIVVFNISYSKSSKAEKIFGNEYCEAVMHMATRDLAKHNCKICGQEFEDSSMRENICTQCAKDTERCDFCGKKLSNNEKEK